MSASGIALENLFYLLFPPTQHWSEITSLGVWLVYFSGKLLCFQSLRYTKLSYLLLAVILYLMDGQVSVVDPLTWLYQKANKRIATKFWTVPLSTAVWQIINSSKWMALKFSFNHHTAKFKKTKQQTSNCLRLQDTIKAFYFCLTEVNDIEFQHSQIYHFPHQLGLCSWAHTAVTGKQKSWALSAS